MCCPSLVVEDVDRVMPRLFSRDPAIGGVVGALNRWLGTQFRFVSYLGLTVKHLST